MTKEKIKRAGLAAFCALALFGCVKYKYVHGGAERWHQEYLESQNHLRKCAEGLGECAKDLSECSANVEPFYAQEGQAIDPAPKGPITDEEKIQMLMESMEVVADWLMAAIPNASTDVLNMIMDLSIILGDTEKYSTGDRCMPTWIAYVYVDGKNEVFLCPMFWAMNKEERAQVLLHEYAHLSGQHNECHATATELIILSLAGDRPHLVNGYVDNCGIAGF